MATFGDLRTELRDFKLVEAATDYFEPDDLLTLLENAANEIASAFRFPKDAGTVTVSTSATSFTPPSGTRGIETVSFGGMKVARASHPLVLFLQEFAEEVWPRAWFWDASQEGDVEFGPPVSSGGDFSVRYVKQPHASAVTSSTTVWDGLFPGFHEVVLLRATVKAFEMSYEIENAQWNLQRYQMLLQEMATHAGMSVPTELVPQGRQEAA